MKCDDQPFACPIGVLAFLIAGQYDAHGPGVRYTVPANLVDCGIMQIIKIFNVSFIQGALLVAWCVGVDVRVDQ